MPPSELPIARFPLPDDWSPADTMCVRVVIPDDPQYLATLVGLLDTLKWSTSFDRDDTKTGAATVARTWRAAMESEPIETEGCNMPDFRVDPDTCALQVDCGDGNWRNVFSEDSTPADLPTDDPPYPDPPEGQTGMCLSAANVTQTIKELCRIMANGLDGEQFILTIVSDLMGILTMLWTFLTNIFIGQIQASLLTLDADTILADFDGFDWQELQDLLACYFEADGSISFESYTALLDAITERIPDSQIWYLAHFWVQGAGVGGLYAMARLGGVSEAECDSCLICGDGAGIQFDADNSAWPNWENYRAGYSIISPGAFEAGEGWSESEANPSGNLWGVMLKLDSPDMVVNKITIRFAGHNGDQATAYGLGYGIWIDGGVVAAVGWSAANVDFDVTIEWTGSVTCDQIALWCDIDGGALLEGAFAYAKSIVICGTNLPTGGTA